MNRLLIGIFLLISLSLACDTPYEEIQGVKIGCEFTGGDGFKKVKLEGAWGASSYEKDKGVKFFDSIQVETDKNNNIIGIGFIKNYPITMSNMEIQEKKIIKDFKQFTDSLEKRWGEFDKSNAKDIYSSLKMDGAMFMSDVDESIFNSSPKSEFLGKIVMAVEFKSDSKKLMQDKPQEAVFAIAYVGKSTAEEMQKKKESVTDGF